MPVVLSKSLVYLVPSKRQFTMSSKNQENCCSEIPKNVGMTQVFKKSYKNTRTKKEAVRLDGLFFDI